ncbi:hypothetical protein TNCT_65201 [Trichonephila clavata]|uniref:Uncharacterized protein n=1 Tax=Trichonephila clavata TaxID=2740835 RepID=A0A8X6JK28_TRICU|nr:hypothetical protein TNCT_65201 [Trichonephila clavata]
MWTIQPSFIVSKSLERYGNGLDGFFVTSTTTIRPNVSEFLLICFNETSRVLFRRILSLGMNHGFTARTSKESLHLARNFTKRNKEGGAL